MSSLGSASKDVSKVVLAPDGVYEWMFTQTFTEAGTYSDVATVTGHDNEKNPATASDDETVKVLDTPPSVALDKSVDVDYKDEPGGVFTFTLTITNDGVEAFTITDLTDTNLPTLTPEVAGAHRPDPCGRRVRLRELPDHAHRRWCAGLWCLGERR